MKLPTKQVDVIDNTVAGNRIRVARETAGMTMDALADEIGCTRSYLSLLERGARNWTQGRFDLALAAIKNFKPE